MQFLLPQAYQMTRREWEICRGVYERNPQARDDLRRCKQLLEVGEIVRTDGSPDGLRSQRLVAQRPAQPVA